MDSYLLRDVALARSQVAELKALWRRTRDERDLLLAKLQQLQQAQQVGPGPEPRGGAARLGLRAIARSVPAPFAPSLQQRAALSRERATPRGSHPRRRPTPAPRRR
jgi:hypothetical protein